MKSLGLLIVHKWAQNLKFSELGRNKLGFAGIERSEMKSCKNKEQGGKISHPAKIRNPCEILQGLQKFATLAKFCRGCKNSQPLQNLAFNQLKTASLWLTTPTKQNITIRIRAQKCENYD